MAHTHMGRLPALNRAGPRNGQHRHSPREHFRGEICLAAFRAFTAAEFIIAMKLGLTLREAAMRCGSNIRYVRAAIILLEHGDQNLIDQVLHGERNILVAAASVQGLVKLIALFKTVSAETRAAFHSATGSVDLSTPAARTAAAGMFDPETIWEDMVLPSLGSNGGHQPHAPSASLR